MVHTVGVAIAVTAAVAPIRATVRVLLIVLFMVMDMVTDGGKRQLAARIQAGDPCQFFSFAPHSLK